MRADPLLIVEDSFRIKGRGVVVAPALALGRVSKAARLTFQARAPDGSTFVAAGQLALEHARLTGGGSRWSWVLIVDEACPRLQRGTHVVATAVDPPDALADTIKS